MFTSMKFWFVAAQITLVALCLTLALAGFLKDAPAMVIAGISGFAAIGASISSYHQHQKNSRKVAS
ncbi:hypothetical protein [Glutamicibacter arilaitensis]|uniref:hypothetical protein n=1 Tax=Glutamicibacter arilaitensis TaxID=256701 RepID=UPI00384D4710